MGERPIRVTDLELLILQQLWRSGVGMTVHELLQGWSERPLPGYTTVLKTLQKMESKALVGHAPLGRKYAYHARVSQQQVAQKKLSGLIDHVFGGDKLSFAQYFLAHGEFDAGELAELKLLIAKREKEDSAR
jgi:BlaI family penicillinase repressor